MVHKISMPHLILKPKQPITHGTLLSKNHRVTEGTIKQINSHISEHSINLRPSDKALLTKLNQALLDRDVTSETTNAAMSLKKRLRI